MIHLATKIPHKVYIGVSGGPDSFAALDFLSRDEKRDVTVLNFHHGTKFGRFSQKFVERFCETHGINFIGRKIKRERDIKESPEEYWRNERYAFFSDFNDVPIVLAHTIDDAIETWLFSSFHGNPQLIPLKRGNFIRPFLLTTKSKLIDWCDRHNLSYLRDPSNDSMRYPRVRIRRMIVPQVKAINPGIEKVIRKKYLEII